MKQSVGLIILTDHPTLGRVAILQRRGKFDFETNKPETHPGICQLAVHGGVRESEAIPAALEREVKEELGETAGALIKENINTMQEISRIVRNEHEIINFFLYLPTDILSAIKLHPSADKLIFIREEDLDKIQTATLADEQTGVSPDGPITMWPDDKISLEKAFKISQT